MGETGGDKRFKEQVPQWLQALLKLSWETQEAMFDAEEVRRESADSAAEAEFKDLLRRLWFRYEAKFRHSKKVDVPDELEDAIEEYGVRELEFRQAQELCRKIRDLQEALGHTQFERPTHHERGFGESKKGESG